MKKKISIIIIIIFILITALASYLFYKQKNTTDQTLETKENQLLDVEADKTILIKYSDGMYGLATGDYEIEGELRYFGQINKLSKYKIPQNNEETNNEEFLDSIVVQLKYDYIVIQKNEKLYLFRRILK